MSSAGFVSVDGSPLAMYLALPAGDEPLTIHRAIRPNATVLELGSGPGRLTRVLTALGHSITAVDDSQEMLDHVTGAERVCSEISQLRLDRHFDVVLAASHLINRPGRGARVSLLEVCRRHVNDSSVVLIERYPPGWLATASSSESQLGPVSIAFEPGPFHGEARSATVTYQLDDQAWTQTFMAEDPTDETLRSEAAAVGLRIVRYLDDARTWIELGVA